MRGVAKGCRREMQISKNALSWSRVQGGSKRRRKRVQKRKVRGMKKCVIAKGRRREKVPARSIFFSEKVPTLVIFPHPLGEYILGAILRIMSTVISDLFVLFSVWDGELHFVAPGQKYRRV